MGIRGQEVNDGDEEKVSWEKMEEWRFQRVKKKCCVIMGERSTEILYLKTRS